MQLVLLVQYCMAKMVAGAILITLPVAVAVVLQPSVAMV